jgi:hypothetical protein
MTRRNGYPVEGMDSLQARSLAPNDHLPTFDELFELGEPHLDQDFSNKGDPFGRCRSSAVTAMIVLALD